MSSDFPGETFTAGIRKPIAIKGILTCSDPGSGGNHLLPLTHPDVVTEANDYSDRPKGRGI
ncbi:MAG: hypothetical protein KAS73_15530 [Candidatus Sabulitectum sp.]|nr:hypothetical protein [Candidatus Sabulitectum sp.]